MHRLIGAGRRSATTLRIVPLTRGYSTAASCPLLAKYHSLLSSGALKPDAGQRDAADHFSRLRADLVAYKHAFAAHRVAMDAYNAKRLQKLMELKEAESKRLADAASRPEQQTSDGVFGNFLARLGPQRPPPALTADRLEELVDEAVGPPPAAPSPPRGMYLWGSVGTGKSVLMDLFFEAAADVVGPERARRVHFNSAMLELHSRLHKIQQAARTQPEFLAGDGLLRGGDASAAGRAEAGLAGGAGGSEGYGSATIGGAAASYARAARAALLASRRRRTVSKRKGPAGKWGSDTNAAILREMAEEFMGPGVKEAGFGVLALDEFQVNDPYTAVVLKAFLETLLDAGVVTTANREPGELDAGVAQQRELFDEFVATLKAHCQPVQMRTETDYRRELSASLDRPLKVYFHPPGVEDSAEHLRRLLSLPEGTLTGLSAGATTAAAGAEPLASSSAPSPFTETTVEVLFGRKLTARTTAEGVAVFEFDELCRRTLGAADYLAVAQRFHTIAVLNVPQMSSNSADAARRFITLIDEVYNHRCALLMTAAAPPDELFAGTEHGTLIDLEALQFEGEVEGRRSRRDVKVSGDVAPVASTKEAMAGAVRTMSGSEERFAFLRAISRLHEIRTLAYWSSRRRWSGPPPPLDDQQGQKNDEQRKAQ